MKQRVKVGEAGAATGQFREISVLDGEFVIDILEHNDYDAIEMMRTRPRCGAFGFFPFALRRLVDLGLIGLIGGSDLLRRHGQEDQQKGRKDWNASGGNRPQDGRRTHLAFLYHNRAISHPIE